MTLFIIFAVFLFVLNTAINATVLNVVVFAQNLNTEDLRYRHFQNSLNDQAKKTNIDIRIKHADSEWGDTPGWWAIWPILSKFGADIREGEWTVFCDVWTHINLSNFLKFLSENFLNPSQLQYFIGKSLQDKQPVIIHHYDMPDHPPFLYPDIALGVIFSQKLLNTLIENCEHFGQEIFTIDSNYELAKLVSTYAKTTLNLHHTLTINEIDEKFCINNKHYNDIMHNCITVYEAPNWLTTNTVNCDEYDDEPPRQLLSNENVFFAVKTFSEYHRTRVPVLKRTWAKHLKNLAFFSDQSDKSLPEVVNLGIPNTERGHCQKTFAIFEYFLNLTTAQANAQNKYSWLVLADDDTLLSVTRLLRLLSCATHNDTPLILGQRYGYGFSANKQSGYDYPTGGAGIIFTFSAVSRLLNGCSCPNADSPDDMIIGMCAKALKISIIDVPGLHQAQPLDYSNALLERQQPLISFHKFEKIDPYDVYFTMLKENDNLNVQSQSQKHKREL